MSWFWGRRDHEFMTDELRYFLELNLPKVMEGKKAKFNVSFLETKIGSHTTEATKIPCQCPTSMNCFAQRLHSDQFIEQLKPSDLEKAQLGLGHSYSRAKATVFHRLI